MHSKAVIAVEVKPLKIPDTQRYFSVIQSLTHRHSDTVEGHNKPFFF